MRKVNILDVKFNYINMKQATKLVVGYFETEGIKTITTANPEIVMMARKDEAFLQAVNKSDLTVADGIGIIYGAKMIKQPLPERVAGYDLIQNIFGEIANTSYRSYFLGAGPGIAEKAAENMKAQFPGLDIAGQHDGYFKEEDVKDIIREINDLKVDFLLVGLGAPKQECWIQANKERLNVKVIIGCGGSFDGMSGNVKRAPKLFIKLHLEWFYRLIKQPSRAGRMLQLPLFIIEMIKVRIKKVQ